MTIDEFIVIFEKEAEANLIKVKESNIKKLYDYMNYILEWNKVINLTAIEDEEEFIVKHFIDSLTILKYINDGIKLIDIGTGAGFPGMPIKLLNDTVNITLVDSVNKKMNVLKKYHKK